MTDTTPIRIIIADDHSVVRAGLKFLLATELNIDIVGEAENGEMAVALAQSLKPDVVLLDMMMPRMNGVEATQAIRASLPQTKILILTSFGEDKLVFSAIKAGALGYLLKDSAPETLMQAIRDVANGEPSLQPQIARKLLRELKAPAPELPPTADPLTERELEVLKLVAQGMTNQEIADSVVVSERTVRAHVSSVLHKLHLANRTQAALYALRTGIAQLD
jgi:NarL family two-component system response regulator LiaR